MLNKKILKTKKIRAEGELQGILYKTYLADSHPKGKNSAAPINVQFMTLNARVAQEKTQNDKSLLVEKSLAVIEKKSK